MTLNYFLLEISKKIKINFHIPLKNSTFAFVLKK